MKPSKAQIECLKRLAATEDGGLHWERGGFWYPTGTKLGHCRVPEYWVATRTMLAMMRNGWLAMRENTGAPVWGATRYITEAGRAIAAGDGLAIGARVTIRCSRSWAHQQWSIVKHWDGEHYHVAIYGGDEMQLIFTRRELLPAK